MNANPDQSWAVVGATGFVGSMVRRQLGDAGQSVRSVRAPRLSCSGKSVEAVLAQGHQSPELDDLSEQLCGADVVINAAGLAEPDAGPSPELSGANALLPVVVALAAGRVGARLVIHISSAAVQGRRRVLTEDTSVAPFSPYSEAKALGEQALRMLNVSTPIVVIRATSVQGRDRATTAAVRRIARSRLASVAGDGRQPSAVSSVAALAALVAHVGTAADPVPPVVLQPWEGLSVADVLRSAGGREPVHLPPVICRMSVEVGYLAARLFGGRGVGTVRRVESMWLGQNVQAEWAQQTGFHPVDGLPDLLGTTER